MRVATTESIEAQLQELLSEGVTNAVKRERTAFDSLTHPFQESLVLFGAGKLGRKTLAGLRTVGIEPLAFIDRDERLWGTSIDGTRVYSPGEGAREFGNEAAFVITIWGYGTADPMWKRRQWLHELGCQRVAHFIPLFWKYPDIFLPHNALDLPHLALQQTGQIMECFRVLHDERSKRELVGQVTWRIEGDFDALPDPVTDEIYFPHEISALTVPEVFVDCGAYDGDTIRKLVALRPDCCERIFAFEPDPANLEALRRTISELPHSLASRIFVMPFATAAVDGTANFSATGTLGACIENQGNIQVECVRLDRVLADAPPPTYIKLDIEAAEPDALVGAQNIIRRHAPVIAACSYHVQDHAWRVPLTLYNIQPDYAILLRPHTQLVEDLVCYAIPKHRLNRN